MNPSFTYHNTLNIHNQVGSNAYCASNNIINIQNPTPNYVQNIPGQTYYYPTNLTLLPNPQINIITPIQLEKHHSSNNPKQHKPKQQDNQKPSNSQNAYKPVPLERTSSNPSGVHNLPKNDNLKLNLQGISLSDQGKQLNTNIKTNNSPDKDKLAILTSNQNESHLAEVEGSTSIDKERIIKHTLLNDYIIDFVIETNMYGNLYKVTRKKDGKLFALQSIGKTNKLDLLKIRTRVKEKFTIYKEKFNYNFQELFEIYEENDSFYISSELYEYPTLLSKLSIQEFSDYEIILLAKYLLNLIDYCYNQNLPFPNIVLENIRFKKDNNSIEFKLCDNGIYIFEEFNLHISKMINQVIFYSPTRARNEVRNINSDIWSVGILLTVILIGKFPFLISGVFKIVNLLKNYKFQGKDLGSSSWSLHSPNAYSFICECLSEKEVSVKSLLSHDWLNEVYNKNGQNSNEIDKLIKKKLGVQALIQAHINILTYIFYNHRLEKNINILRDSFAKLDTNDNGRILVAKVKLISNNLEFNSFFVDTALENTKIVEKKNENETKEVYYGEFLGRLIEALLHSIETNILENFRLLTTFFDKKQIPNELFAQIVQGDYTYFNSQMHSLMYSLDLTRSDPINCLEFFRALQSFCKVSSVYVKIMTNKK